MDAAVPVDAKNAGAFATMGGSRPIGVPVAGGSVMSLMTRRDNGIVVAVASNIAHANTAALALKVADVFSNRNKPRFDPRLPDS